MSLTVITPDRYVNEMSDDARFFGIFVKALRTFLFRRCNLYHPTFRQPSRLSHIGLQALDVAVPAVPEASMSSTGALDLEMVGPTVLCPVCGVLQLQHVPDISYRYFLAFWIRFAQF